MTCDFLGALMRKVVVLHSAVAPQSLADMIPPLD
jgi:hypothetical protein